MFGKVTVLYLWIMIFKFQFDSIYLIYSKFTGIYSKLLLFVMFFIFIFISTWDLFKFSLFFGEFSFEILLWKLCHFFKCLFYVFWEIARPFILFKFTKWFIVSFLSPLIFLMFCTGCIHLKRSGHSDYFVSFVYFRVTGGINGAEDT